MASKIGIAVLAAVGVLGLLAGVTLAGTATATCLPWCKTSRQCLAWLGASVATNTASILSSFTSSSRDG